MRNWDLEDALLDLELARLVLGLAEDNLSRMRAEEANFSGTVSAREIFSAENDVARCGVEVRKAQLRVDKEIDVTNKESFIALLESFGYKRTTDVAVLTSGTSPVYLEDVRGDGGSCVILGDGGACPVAKTVAAKGYGCSPGCCCQFCFNADGSFLGHCCCSSVPRITKAK